MIKWIIANQEWLFSGVGVALIAGLIALVQKIRSSRISNIQPEPKYPFDSGEYAPLPFPQGICADIAETPPYQRQMKSVSYAGQKIQWLVTLQNILDRGNDMVHLMLWDRGHYPWVYCDTTLNDYPQLKISRTGRRIWIAGAIATVDEGGITVAVDKMFFLDDA